MFTAMGLSAVFPVLHGLGMHGIEQMNRQIGLSWVVTQGCLYVLGAAIYAVGIALDPSYRWSGSGAGHKPAVKGEKANSISRPEYRKDGILVDLTFGGAHIRFSMSWLCWRRLRILSD